MPLQKKHVLVTGGSGYLGQFVVQHFAGLGCQVVFTHYSTAAPLLGGENVKAKWVNLVTGEGLAECFDGSHPFDAVINTAAMSQPGLCERDPALARSINVPEKVVAALKERYPDAESQPLLIHISTDQVYDGSKADWTEEDACRPVNVYGSSKLEAEHFLRAHWPRHVLLRSSIIYGPQSPVPVARPLFLQFVVQQLAEQKETTFFQDEYRSPVYVADIVDILFKLVLQKQELPRRTYHMGGPARLSRLDMARAVAEVCGFPTSSIVAAPASSVQRPARSPADISMDSRRLEGDLGIKLTAFSDALKQMHQDGALEPPMSRAESK